MLNRIPTPFQYCVQMWKSGQLTSKYLVLFLKVFLKIHLCYNSISISELTLPFDFTRFWFH